MQLIRAGNLLFFFPGCLFLQLVSLGLGNDSQLARLGVSFTGYRLEKWGWS